GDRRPSVSQTLIAAIGFLGGMVVALVDGPRAIAVASLAAGLGLAGAAASIGGVGAALLPLVGGAAAVLAAALARGSGERLRGVAGLSPEVPVVAPRDALFGPRSVRVVAAALAAVSAAAAGWLTGRHRRPPAPVEESG